MSSHFRLFLEQNKVAISQEVARQKYVQMPGTYKEWVDESTFVDFFSSQNRSSFYFHDYEAGGTDPAVDIPLQHAGIRTDLSLRILDEPNNWYCLPSGERMPHPQALLITKISLKKVREIGLPEPVFFRKIHQEMSVYATCNTGFNSLKYDDEMSRFGFYRNLLPVYSHEWANGNSRWDLLPLTAAVAAWDPEHYIWPINDDGKRSLRLEMLARANGLTQENAHNAVDDVLATIQWARCIKEKSPALFEHFYARRMKSLISKDMVVGSVGFFASPMYISQNYAVPALVLGTPYGQDKNKLILLDLSDIDNLRRLWALSKQQGAVELIREQLYLKSGEQPENFKRLPIIQTAVNKCPMFIPYSNPFVRIVDQDGFNAFLQAINSGTPDADNFKKVIISACSNDYESTPGAPAEITLYVGFPGREDQQNIQIISTNPLADALNLSSSWVDPKYDFLHRLMKCKMRDGDPLYATLIDDELDLFWQEHKLERLKNPLRRKEKHQSVSLDNLQGILRDLDATHLWGDYLEFWPELAFQSPIE